MRRRGIGRRTCTKLQLLSLLQLHLLHLPLEAEPHVVEGLLHGEPLSLLRLLRLLCDDAAVLPQLEHC